MKMMLPAAAIVLSAIPQVQALQRPPSETNPPPVAVADLAATGSYETVILMQWMAPSDLTPKISLIAEIDDLIGGSYETGPATAYDLRYSLIDPATAPATWWTDATPAVDDDPMMPQAPGATETVYVSGLEADTTYYFAIKSRDAIADHWSAQSNVCVGVTAAAFVAPPEPEIEWEYDGPDSKSAGPCGSSAAGHASGALLVVGLALVLRR